MTDNTRIKALNNKGINNGGKYVIYWMQQSQRADYNHAFEYAKQKANELNLPLIVYFGVTASYTDANLRHYYFMFQNLVKLFELLEKQKVKFVINYKSPEKGIFDYADDSALIVVDRGYLKIQKYWRSAAAEKYKYSFIQIESDAIAPVEAVSDKEEYAARTIRNKINSKLSFYLKELKSIKIKKSALFLQLKSEKISLDSLKKLKINKSVAPSRLFEGGTDIAKLKLKEFIKTKLNYYGSQSNHPGKNLQSDLSPYLHFGQISSLYIALEVLKAKTKQNEKNIESFLEELIVRRELSFNFVNYNIDYDNYACAPDWAKKSLKLHKKDKREFVYSSEEFENYKTHDKYWNAAQKEMVLTGKMHGYMRMYWGKKIIEWSDDPEKAYRLMLYLNNKYEIDGRDPNAYAGVAWCFGKHDRPWGERKILGNVRYMNAKGLERKFDMSLYSL